jgi:hypothetical protein
MGDKYRQARRRKETLLILKRKPAKEFFFGFSIYRYLPDAFCAFIAGVGGLTLMRIGEAGQIFPPSSRIRVRKIPVECHCCRRAQYL